MGSIISWPFWASNKLLSLLGGHLAERVGLLLLALSSD
jgi:hypothetical protein